MKEIPNLDELLNSSIDGELPPRQQTEVQRLIAHDEKIAQRLRQLQKCKMLLNSLPVAEAPPEILENVKVSLARRTLLGEQPSAFDERVGARHLLGRKVFAAAAMLGLVGILTAVVYTIVAPQPGTQGPVVERRDLPPKVDVLEPAVVSIINKAIEENIPSDEWIASDRSYVREPHALICSNDSFNLILAKIDSIWDKLESATLFVGTEVFGEQVVVDAVTAEQIAGIVNQEDPQRRIKVAKDFAAFNHITERMPGREILTAIDDTTVRFITPPKPALTQDEKTFRKLATGTKADKNIRLTITVMAGN
jgi:hypothetical protein